MEPFKMALESGSSASPSSSQLSEVTSTLVKGLGDESPAVRKAMATALCQNAQWNALPIIDYCISSLKAVKRWGTQVGDHRASVLAVMAHTVAVVDEKELDKTLMQKIAAIALTEMASSKDLDSNWQHSASSLLVALASRMPDLIMNEIFLQLGSNQGPVLAIVQALAEFASVDALGFVPHMKGVLSRILPLLGGLKDAQKSIFAEAFKCWCEALSRYVQEQQSVVFLGPDMQALLHSAFDLFLGRWIFSRDSKVRLATVDALGCMFKLIDRLQLKAATMKVVPSLLGVYNRELENLFPVTHTLHMLFDAVLSDHEPQLLDFPALIPILNAILPMASIYATGTKQFNFKNFNEVLRCYVIVGITYPKELLTYMLNHLGAKDIHRLGTFLLMKHLLPRLSREWSSQKSALIHSIKSSLSEHDLNFRKAMAELIVMMASIGYLEGGDGQLFIEFLVKQSAIDESEIINFRTQQKALERSYGTDPTLSSTGDLKLGAVSPSELRVVGDKSLYLMAATIPMVEPLLWPYLLQTLIEKCYTGAVATICKCISEILRRRLSSNETIALDYNLYPETPCPEAVLARLLVLLQNPMARNQLAARILTVLYYLAPLFPTSIGLIWKDEIPKLKAYISDPEDLKGESWQREVWEQMILHLLSESLDVVQNPDWIMSLGNALTNQYMLYCGDHYHSALLHRCLGMVLQKVENRSLVKEKIAVMYKHANIADPIDRLGLAMGMGLVAASHLDTVLDKLKNVLENEGQRSIRRFFSSFFVQKASVDDIYAALALMYGYAASYAPSTVIEARIDKLVGTNVLSRLLDVKGALAKQAVITAINLLGQAVIKAAANGAPFPLKRRDIMLDYIMALMVGQGSGYLLGTPDALDFDLLLTQELAIDACTTLVSVEPKLAAATRDRVLQATLGFFTLPAEPSSLICSLLAKLTTLLVAILQTSGEDGRSRADQFHHLLKSLDVYVSSPIEYQRQRACNAVHAILLEFRAFCMSGPPLMPSRDALRIGERVMVYLPRSMDVCPTIRKTSAQIFDLLFSISLILPKHVGSANTENRQTLYTSLSSLEELIAVTKWETSSQLVLLDCIVDVIGILLTVEELVGALRCCEQAICDKVPSCGEGATVAIRQLITERGMQLPESHIPRITQSLFTAGAAIVDANRRQKVLEAICCLSQQTNAHVVFNELLTSSIKELHRRDGPKQRGAWHVNEAIMAFTNNEELAVPFLDYIVGVLDNTPIYNESVDKAETDRTTQFQALNLLPIAAVRALGVVFRGGGHTLKKALEQRYPEVFASLLLQTGSARGAAIVDPQPLRDIIQTLQYFCDFVGDREMEAVVGNTAEEKLLGTQWIETISKLAGSSALLRPTQVARICSLLWPALKQTYDYQRVAAAAALCEYVNHCNKEDVLLSQLVGILSGHIGDDSSLVRRLCVKGLIQVPQEQMPKYASQVLSVIVALIEDSEEDVALTAVEGLPAVLEDVNEESVAPVLLNLCVRLRSLQGRENVKMRAASFSAFGKLSNFATADIEAFLEQVHTILPRLVFHMNDEATLVRQACKTTFQKIAPLLYADETRSFSKFGSSDHRLDYDVFLEGFTRHLIKHFSDRIDTYISSAIQAFDSPWPVIQANAIYFAACLLSHLNNRRSLAVYIPQVVNLLVKLAASSSSVVRLKAASALGKLSPDLRQAYLP